MNYPSLRYVQGRLIQICSLLFLFPLLVALIYREALEALTSFGLVALVFFCLGSLLTLKRPERIRLRALEGMVLTFSTWLLLSLAGGAAFHMSGQFPSFIDAFFESASGFTTTGSTILTDVESLSHFNLFWRSFSHFVGGMGVLVFAFLLQADPSADSVHLMKAEMPGPHFEKLTNRVRQTALILYAIYFVMTLLTILFLFLGGMPLFDALIHGMGAAGTGGFSNKNASIGFYQSSYINWVLTLAMVLFGVNFQVYFLALKKGIRQALKSEELRWYLALYLTVSLLVFLSILPGAQNGSRPLEEAFFTVSSLMTTTGYATVNFALWPLVSQVLLLFVILLGASAGSTGGGLKVSRFMVYVKSARQEIAKSRDPRRVVAVRVDGKLLSDQALQPVLRYLFLYLLFLGLGSLILALDSPDLMTAFSSAATALNNVGPGLSLVGPAANFSGFHGLTKLVLAFLMLAGRLELMPMILFFSVRTWKRT